jgi:indole-3-glycerol phosphate synthase
VLVEVHTAEELSVAVGAGAGIVGVNNRNLRTLAVDVQASAALAPRIPPRVVRVSESGRKTPHHNGRMRELGYDAFLIGERFMTRDDPGSELRALLETQSC